MRVVLVGQKWLAVQLLERCRTLGIEIVLVVVPAPVDGQPDSLERAAAAQGLAVCRTGWRLGAEQVPPCDLVLAAHAHAYIDAGARGQARLGALGFHPSLLPRHRGRDAVRWAVHMREAVTGGSLYWMDDGADTGPVVAQSWCHIRPDDTPTTLWRRELAPMGLDLFDQVLARLLAGERCQGVAQDEALATWEPAWSGKRLGVRTG
ncbi:TPA: formyl transferase [Pseudomonas aeruginosa]|uniref:formyltransferase family protein n=1 Tax=Pseudomonas aeruginosa TaxID=287 RepID=UPI00047307E3|nr:methionyl-tRNA formyltransferase [Pseudomonas aeruginosa]KSG40501.1 methionyl-tRNA formyltransferase [Pseudomonas aeruginosa]KSI04567.1 methionyl-tRNA formyltransferase [Pseudomonas aeruginosa]KSM13632.1 methionyl-tRNA formyltransferase [Pseudomonas aeruginosa]MBG4328715.1 methionyl-tRNA formyltransferase [Pseudomonas aeruginosa]